METEKKLELLQLIYAGIIADSALQMGKAGILETVTVQKREEQLLTGKTKAMQFGITKPEQVFLTLSDIFNCAKWELITQPSGFHAETKACVLCGLAKKMGAQKPCNLYCLDPMEGMIKGLDNSLDFTVMETLWNGKKCSIQIKDKIESTNGSR